ncbi:hypothetical protein G6F61_013736 [Rhizopus arrhizus]|nr:hypothetical protein G6F61_013736 [Rhizopus arrhizus]
MRFSLAPALGLHGAGGIGQRMGQRARCKGRGIRMRAQIGTGGDIAGQCCEAAWAVAERLGLLAQAQRDLAEEQGQAGKQRCLQQRWPGRGTFQQRLQQRERANATGQPYRQAIAVAEQHAQHNASCSGNSNARPLRARL